MPTIESRITIDVNHSQMHRGFLFSIYDRYTGESYLKSHLVSEYDPELEMHDVAAWAYTWIHHNLMEVWPTCASTLTMEQKSRKTIISSCGQLKVSESHYLMVT